MAGPTEPDENSPQGGAQQDPPGRRADPPPGSSQPGSSQPGYGQSDYSQPGYTDPGYGAPAPSYPGGPAPTGPRPGMVTAAAVIGIVWGALGLLFGLLALGFAFAIGAFYGLVLLVSIVLSAALLWAGIQVLQGRSPRLLLLICYIAIGINLLSLVIGLAQGDGSNAFSGILGFLVPGVVVALLLNPQTKQHYASRGIGY